MTGAPVIEQILYISTISSTEAVDLDTILATSRRNNRAHGVTGLLLFNGKRFLQVLEGPPEVISATYNRISRDARHRAPVLLARKPISEREFGEWSMGFRDAKAQDSQSVYDMICAKVANANPNLRAELTAFARQL